MPKIRFTSHQGEAQVIDAEVGISLMQNAVDNDVVGIDADCGGACACATCHVFVDAAWLSTLEPMDEMEKSMLALAERVVDNSRLSCQIIVKESHDGMAVKTPESQY